MDERLNVRYTCLMSKNNHNLGKTESLTVVIVNGLKLCTKTSVHIGGIRGKLHGHCIGVTSFRHCSVPLNSTQSEDETSTSSDMSALLCNSYVDFRDAGLDSLLSVDLHIVFATVRTVFQDEP